MKPYLRRIAALLFLSCSSVMGAHPQWPGEAGTTSDGSITVNTITQEDSTTAVSKADQNALTQPPTVVIQPTGNGAPSWIWEDGKQPTNTPITLKAVSGPATYNATENPTGAVAKANQNAVTQPPVIIIQATGSGPVFSYKDDCYILKVSTTTAFFIAAGKLDTAANPDLFTGMMGGTNNNTYNNPVTFAGGQVLSALTGTGFSGADGDGSSNPMWCDNSATCISSNVSKNHVFIVSAMPVTLVKKCY